ncbi:MAG: polysaccharide biosynthesis C-terminal domain-containing protein, partial [Treponema sp.]|nr:polysaccharide biosynthesis C-terminal domain-containing protein [Treponema sp.]
EAFTFHMPGLYFIALNRILAPAFYAQSNSKSPAIAGIISFGVNMVLAALLVSRYKGAGIALALSIASAFNTAALLVFLKKNPEIKVGATVKSTLLYAFKIMLFSGVAVIPVLVLSPALKQLFAGRNRIMSEGLPLFINALFFIGAGILLLAITRDRQFTGILKMIKKRSRSAP